jgi:hypothetical protein
MTASPHGGINAAGIERIARKRFVFAIVCRNGDFRPRDVKGGAALTASQAQAVLDRPLTEALSTEITSGNRTHVQLSEHVCESSFVRH